VGSIRKQLKESPPTEKEIGKKKPLKKMYCILKILNQ